MYWSLSHLKYPDQNSDDELIATPSNVDDRTTIFLQNDLDQSTGSGMSSPVPEEEELTQMPPVRDLDPTTWKDPQSRAPPTKGSDVTPESKTNTSRGFC